MPVISLTKELNEDKPFYFPERYSSNLVIIENAFQNVDTIISSISGNFQNQLDTFSTSFIGLNDTPSSYNGSDTYVVTVSGERLVFTPQSEIIPQITNIRGQQECTIGQQVYTISYGKTISNAQPVTSLITPSSESTIFVTGVFDVTETNFKVILSEAPTTSGYFINWVTSFGSTINLDDSYVNINGDAMNGTLFVPSIGSHANPVTDIHLNQCHLEPVSANPPYKEGMLFYDGDKRVLKVYNDIPDVSLDIGEENWVRIINKTGSTITNGKIVYINGAQGNRPTVALADKNDPLTSHTTIGMATHDIANNQEGFVTTFGLVRNVNTSTYSEGDVLWVDTNGDFTATKSTTPQHSVRIGYVVVAHATQGTILVSVDVGSDMDELHDVSLTSLTNGQFLTYSQALSAWTNSTLTVNVSGYVEKTGDTMTGPLVINGPSDFLLDVNNSSNTLKHSVKISNPTHSMLLGTVSQFLVIDTAGVNSVLDLRRAGTSRMTFSGNNILFKTDVAKVEIEGTSSGISTVDAQLVVKGGVGVVGNTNVGGYVRSSALRYSTKTTNYTTTITDGGTIVYISSGITLTLNQTPIDGEHLWICNEGSVDSVIDGGENTIQRETTQVIPPDSVFHLHYKNNNWRAI